MVQDTLCPLTFRMCTGAHNITYPQNKSLSGNNCYMWGWLFFFEFVFQFCFKQYIYCVVVQRLEVQSQSIVRAVFFFFFFFKTCSKGWWLQILVCSYIISISAFVNIQGSPFVLLLFILKTRPQLACMQLMVSRYFIYLVLVSNPDLVHGLACLRPPDFILTSSVSCSYVLLNLTS